MILACSTILTPPIDISFISAIVRGLDYAANSISTIFFNESNSPFSFLTTFDFQHLMDFFKNFNLLRRYASGVLNPLNLAQAFLTTASKSLLSNHELYSLNGGGPKSSHHALKIIGEWSDRSLLIAKQEARGYKDKKQLHTKNRSNLLNLAPWVLKEVNFWPPIFN